MHVALPCPDMLGHLNPMTAFGRALADRGHRVSLACSPEFRSLADGAGLGFIPLGQREYDDGSFAADRRHLGQLSGFKALRFTAHLLTQGVEIVLRDLPAAVRDHGIDAVVSDQVLPGGACVAIAYKLPFAVVCNALALHVEPLVPPPSTRWRYRTGWFARQRNRLGNFILLEGARPVFAAMKPYRAAHGIEGWSLKDMQKLGLIQLAQQPAFFDYPRERLPAQFHYTGPWHFRGRDGDVPFPWERLDGRPIVFASLGTLQNRLRPLFVAIAQACDGLGVQLVMALGSKAADPSRFPAPDGAIVVPYAPQLALLDRATLCITHAGLNTALEALARGLPMVCLPITNDQPGVAQRVQWLGAGEVLSPRWATPVRLRRAIERVLREPQYRAVAERCRDAMARGPGVRDAAALADRALTTGQRLTREDARREGLIAA